MTEAKAFWVWPDSRVEQVNQYVDLRHTFDVDKVDRKAQLFISADSNYIVWINGIFVHAGQYQCFPGKKYFDLFPIGDYLREGNNLIAIRAVSYGRSSASYVKDSPGILYAAKVNDVYIASSSDTACRSTKSYRQGAMPLMTIQTTFTFEYDSRMDDDWIWPDYSVDSLWGKVSQKQSWKSVKSNLHLRPVERLIVNPRVKSNIAAQGFFRRDFDSSKTIAQLMQNDYLSAVDADKVFRNVCGSNLPVEVKDGVELNTGNCDGDGIYLLFDLGRQECGYLDIEVNSSDGTIVDIAFGEHIDDLRVRAWIDGRNFASRYICREGVQSFTHYTNRIACRYIQLHISELGEVFSINYVGLKPVEYPIDIKGRYSSSNQWDSKINEVAIRTLHLCMHDHYEDTPWREQALYANDSRNQAICGYYCFGEYTFAQASFRLLGEGLKDDGYLELCAPSDVPITIPSFTMVWFLAIRDSLLYSGNLDFTRSIYPQAKKMITAYIDSMVNDLLPSPQGERFWNFYDWAAGLDAVVDPDKNVTEFEVLNKERFDAPLNMFFAMSLEAMSFIADYCNDRQFSLVCKDTLEKIRSKVNDVFWDNDESLYQTYIGEDVKTHFCELSQSLAMCAGISLPQTSNLLRRRIAANKDDIVPTTLSQSFYKYEAMLQDKDQYGRWCFDDIETRWRNMLDKGATTFWETERGGWDFMNAGSLCHGWSAIPVYFYYAYQLGIKPIEPGFRKFSVNVANSNLEYAHGSIPTPYGSINIDWKQEHGQIFCKLEYPEQLEPVILDQRINIVTKTLQPIGVVKSVKQIVK